ncbi:MAG: dephospho-CoA kinase [Faecalibacterium prausnitzii]
MLDGAVIVGTAAQAECDRLCVVTAPFETSVARIVARDGISPEMAARRLNAQTPERHPDRTGRLHPAQRRRRWRRCKPQPTRCVSSCWQKGRDGSALNERNYEKSLRPHRRPERLAQKTAPS